MMSARVGIAPTLKRAAFYSKHGELIADLFMPIYSDCDQPATLPCGLRLLGGIQTESLPPSASQEILNQQRLKRPSSPHFTIYQPQLTWLASIANRATGGALSALLYGFSLAYLFAPGTFDSAHIIEFIAGLPEYVKYAGKFLLAAPFAFHSLNGLRHLAWDTGKFLSLKSAYRTGYAVLGATAISTIALVLM
ncbi:SDHC, cytochrome b subunit of succinate dehydrogenase [Pisolithus croceorrhizus]|nr:SDHC, cytochrome b subunit of succinate dehydrogenase [Pisolithus croceorrhizus]